MKLIHATHKAAHLGSFVMPRWFAPVLAITTIVMVFSGLRVARDKRLVKD